MIDEIIKSIIQNIPLLLEYFVPGFLTIFVYQHIEGKEKNENGSVVHIGACIVISYVLTSLIIILGAIKGIPTVLNSYLRCLIASALGAAISILLSKFSRSAFANKQYSKISKTVLSPDIFENSQFSKHPYITIYGDNEFVTGRVVSYGNFESDSWITLDSFEVYSCEKGLIDHWTNYRNYSQYIIPYSAIKAINVRHASNELYGGNYEIDRIKEKAKHNNKMMKLYGRQKS